jgi:DNA-binding NarL/FixJ family response regulator
MSETNSCGVTTPGVFMRRPQILIGDDHRLVAEGLEKLLQADYDVAEIVEDGWALVAAAERLRPDLILADITMPKLNGLDACEKIVKQVPDAKVIILTMHHDAIYAVRALRSGASGFVLKNSASLELLTAVKTVLDGATYLSPQMAKQLEIYSQNSSADVMDTVTLTPRQRAFRPGGRRNPSHLRSHGRKSQGPHHEYLGDKLDRGTDTLRVTPRPDLELTRGPDLELTRGPDLESAGAKSPRRTKTDPIIVP